MTANLRDYQHASKIFVSDKYALSPKYSFLFHVNFELNPNIRSVSNTNPTNTRLGLMVKSVQLPKYSIDVKTLNAYNRPNIVQNKIKYDPITITFHDDSSDVIRDFWYDYMSHYYADSSYPKNTYFESTKYQEQQYDKWGFAPEAYSNSLRYGSSDEKLLRTVRLYSLHQKRFTEYTLINPIITSFQHGQHEQGKNDFMEHTMTVSYETVLYSYGSISIGDEPSGFATLNYDNTPSPYASQHSIGQIYNPSNGSFVNAPPGSTYLTPSNPYGTPQAGFQPSGFVGNPNQNQYNNGGAQLTGVAQGILGGPQSPNNLIIPALSISGVLRGTGINNNRSGTNSAGVAGSVVLSGNSIGVRIPNIPIVPGVSAGLSTSIGGYNGFSSPSGATPGQPLASTSNVPTYAAAAQPMQQPALASDSVAVSTLQSNGDSIALPNGAPQPNQVPANLSSFTPVGSN
jgi:hypothetical protein